MNPKQLLLTTLTLLLSLTSYSEVIWQQNYNPFDATGYNVRSNMVICQDGSYLLNGYYAIQNEWGSYIEWLGYVMKVSPEGEMLWAKKDVVDHLVETESFAAIETNNGDIINAGDLYVIKRDYNGNRIWTQQTDYILYSLVLDDDGNIVVTGASNQALILRKYDPDWNIVWNKDFKIGTTSMDAGRCMIKCSDGGFAITGTTRPEFYTTRDILITKTNSIGDTLWTYIKDGYGNSDNGNWIIENSENNLLILGSIVSTSQLGYISLFDLSGNKIWETITTEWHEHFYGIDLPEEQSFLIAAGRSGLDVFKCDYSYNITWFDDEAEIINAFFQLNDDGFIFYDGGLNGVELIQRTRELVSNDEISHKHKNNILTNFPNPFYVNTVNRRKGTTISFQLPETAKNAYLEIYNTKGQELLTKQIARDENNYYWSAENQPSGIYFYRIKADNFVSKTKKMLLIK